MSGRQMPRPISESPDCGRETIDAVGLMLGVTRAEAINEKARQGGSHPVKQTTEGVKIHASGFEPAHFPIRYDDIAVKSLLDNK